MEIKFNPETGKFDIEADIYDLIWLYYQAVEYDQTYLESDTLKAINEAKTDPKIAEILIKERWNK